MISYNSIPKVSFSGGFSDRNGIKPLNTEMQVSELDGNTRSDLYNLIAECYERCFQESDKKNYLITSIMKDVFHEPVYYGAVYYRNLSELYNKYVGNIVLNGEYDEVFTLIEYIGSKLVYDNYNKKTELKKCVVS